MQHIFQGEITSKLIHLYYTVEPHQCGHLRARQKMSSLASVHSSETNLVILISGHAVSMINADQYRSMPDQVCGIDPKCISIDRHWCQCHNLIRH